MFKYIKEKYTFNEIVIVSVLKQNVPNLRSLRNVSAVAFPFSPGNGKDTLLTSSQGAGPTRAIVAKRVSHGQTTPSCSCARLSVIMSRCLTLARFALGSSQRAYPRLVSCARGLSTRTVLCSAAGGERCMLAELARPSSCQLGGVLVM